MSGSEPRISPEAAKSTSDLRTNKSPFFEEQEPVPERGRPTAQRAPPSFGQESGRSESNEVFSTPPALPVSVENHTSPRGSERSANRLEPTASIPPLAIPTSLRPGSFIGGNDIKVPSPPEPIEPVKEPVPEPFEDPYKHQPQQPQQPLEEPPAEPPAEPAQEAVKEPIQEPSPSISSKSVKAEPAPPEEPQVSASPTSKPDTPSTEPTEEGSHRPGLGPMVKKKIGGGKDVANTFRKAATAYNAFKPRAGGGAERLKAAKAVDDSDKINGPDGITGVVPAPLRGRSYDSTDVPTPETQAKEPLAPEPLTKELPPQEPVQETPDLQVTEAPPVSSEPVDITPDDSRSKSPVSQGERRRKRREDNTAKYCNALNIDPGLLDGRGVDFDAILTDLGWNGRLDEEKRIEDLEADIRREIGRVQANSWLGHLEQQEGKVEQLAKLFDKTIEECDELDGLLTLYSHELNVSILIVGTARYCPLTGSRHWPMMLRISKPNRRACRFKLPTRNSFKMSCRAF